MAVLHGAPDAQPGQLATPRVASLPCPAAASVSRRSGRHATGTGAPHRPQRVDDRGTAPSATYLTARYLIRSYSQKTGGDRVSTVARLRTLVAVADCGSVREAARR